MSYWNLEAVELKKASERSQLLWCHHVSRKTVIVGFFGACIFLYFGRIGLVLIFLISFQKRYVDFESQKFLSRQHNCNRTWICFSKGYILVESFDRIRLLFFLYNFLPGLLCVCEYCYGGCFSHFNGYVFEQNCCSDLFMYSTFDALLFAKKELKDWIEWSSHFSYSYGYIYKLRIKLWS